MKTLITLVTLSASLLLASAQGLVNDVYSLSNVPARLETMSVSNVSSIVRVRQGSGLTIFPYFAGTNAAQTNDLWLFFDTSPDGTNWSTTQPLRFTFRATGATAARGATNISPDTLSSLAAIKWTYATNNGTASLFITNIMVGRSR